MLKLGVAVDAYSISIWEAEFEDLEFEASLGYIGREPVWKKIF
jgi:hypothetical protein